MANPTVQDIFLPSHKPNKSAKRVLILTADKTEDQEFFYPYYRFVEEGYDVDVATPEGGAFTGKNGAGLQSTIKIKDLQNPTSYDLLYIPGGKAPEYLKKVSEAVKLVQDYAATGSPIAAICHGPQLLAEAGVIEGRTLSGYPEIESELRDAGARYVNSECEVDGQFITARWPGDLPVFTRTVIENLSGGGLSMTSSTTPDKNTIASRRTVPHAAE